MNSDVLAKRMMVATMTLAFACGDSGEGSGGGTGGAAPIAGAGLAGTAAAGTGAGGTAGTTAAGTGGTAGMAPVGGTVATATGGTGASGTGAAGTAGTAGTASLDAGLSTSMDFMCGTTMCSTPDFSDVGAGIDPAMAGQTLGIDPSAFAGLGLMGCCTEDENACGVENPMIFNGCLEQNMPGTADPACPGIEFIYSITLVLPFTLAGSMPSCCNTEVNQCGVDLSQVNIDLGDIGALIGLTEPLSLDVGVGCLPLTETEAVTSSGIQIVSNVDTMNPTPCGNVADAGP